jgi:hypothetical protein
MIPLCHTSPNSGEPSKKPTRAEAIHERMVEMYGKRPLFASNAIKDWLEIFTDQLASGKWVMVKKKRIQTGATTYADSLEIET